MRGPRFATLIAVVALAGAGCGGAVTSVPTTAPTQVATAAPTAAPTVAPAPATPAPTRTAAPTPTTAPTTAPTIGQPADDGARIIAVDAHPPNLVCTYAGCSSPGTFTGARARDLTIDSPAVGTVKVRLLLPRHFDTQPSTRWPVLYLLPGANGPYQTWTDVFDVEELTAPTDLLVVMPDAGDGGWYSDWWNRGEGGPPMWETFHLVELRQLLERNWQAGDKRAIAGISMGGYGAIEYAEHQPGMFRFAASYSGPLDTLGGPDFRSVTGASDSLWGDPVKQVDVWKAHDPTTNAAALKDTALYVAYGNGQLGPLDSGSYDPTGSLERDIAAMSASFVKRLGELKIPVTVYAYTGTHFDPYWERAFERSLPLLLKALGE